MAFVLGATTDKVRVIVSKDSAVKCSDEEYSKYLETNDEALLNLEGSPTRWILAQNLDYKSHQILMNMQATVGAKGKMDFNIGYILEEVRMALVGVENAENLPLNQQIIFKKENDGYAQKELIAGLHSAGVLMDLHTARSNFKNVESTELTKKN